MAIVQISQITNRKGLQIDLPQLAGAELGWSIDERRLFIGNGTLQEGAPVIGNTEILTEFSDILNAVSNYTYNGDAATGYTVQTGVTPGTPVTLTLQNWLDQFATVKDFGATGDGVTDDTDAINRALFQLYCREANPQIRRGLFFPAGVYRITAPINIPPYATLYGEGSDNTLIQLDADVNDYVAQTADSLQQTGVNIGNTGATPPEYITITNMGFTSLNPTGDIFLVAAAKNCTFQNVGFRGASGKPDLTTDANGSSGISFYSTPALVCTQILFDGCVFSGLVWGVNTNQQTNAVTISNSHFDTLYRGVALGTAATTNGGPTGTRIVGNMFDNIYVEGIVFGGNLTLGINASGQNIFYDVGNNFTGSSGTPASSIISILSNNNVSISDLFQRTAAFATLYPRVSLGDTTSIAMTNGELLTMGSWNRATGSQLELLNNFSGVVFSQSSDVAKAFTIEYTVVREQNYRTGKIFVATDGASSNLTFNDQYVENSSTGVSLNVSQAGSTVSLNYTTTNTGFNGTIYYSVTYLA